MKVYSFADARTGFLHYGTALTTAMIYGKEIKNLEIFIVLILGRNINFTMVTDLSLIGFFELQMEDLSHRKS